MAWVEVYGGQRSLAFELTIAILAVVTLQTFYLGKHDLLTVYLGKLFKCDRFFPR